MSTVIKAEGLSKKYIIGHQRQEPYLTLRDTMSQKFREIGKRLLHPFLSSSGQPLTGLAITEDLWALKDVSFEISQGDRIGIIGRNGAGKTTLLKILSRITEPSEGRVSIKGRVASLLEVGTGFHPELTGRENIFLNGAVLGMSKAEIEKKFDEIVAFAELEKFLDTPVKRYSSGMYVRLAFAVAAHLEPEILLVDEVLAVGDAAFQKKCLGKMWHVAREGRTVLFVSHNMVTISALCSRALLIEEGMIASQGETSQVVSEYEKKMNRLSSTTYLRASKPLSTAWIEEAALKASNGNPGTVFSMTEAILLYVSIRFEKKMEGLRLAVKITEMNGSPIYHIMNVDSGFDISHNKGVLKFLIHMDNLKLFPNSYLISLDLASSTNETLDLIENRLRFTIAQDAALCRRKLPRSAGIVFSLANWKLLQRG